jgi:hypothetical protein
MTTAWAGLPDSGQEWFVLVDAGLIPAPVLIPSIPNVIPKFVNYGNGDNSPITLFQFN